MKIRPILMKFLYPLFFLPLALLADDTGMVKARLFEDSVGVYVLEVDISPQLMGYLSYPELPERFKGSERIEIKGESSLITVRYFFSCPYEPLNRDDVIILNWNRRGISMTAQWQDGEYVRSFFTRGPGGFSIPIKKLRAVTELYPELNQNQFLGGLKYPFGSLAYLLFIIFLIYIAGSKDSIKILFALFAGQAVSLILIELGMIAMPMGIVELMMLLAILISIISFSKISLKNILPMFFIVGILSGLGFGQAFWDTGIPKIDILTASFFFHLGLDIFLLAVYLIISRILIILKLFDRIYKHEKLMFYGIGSIAVLFFLITFNAIHGNEKTYGLNLPGNPEAAKIQIPKGLIEKAAALSKPVPIGVLQSPVEVFLSMEPFEVKCEVLVKISELNSWTANYQDLKKIINIEDQDLLIEDLLRDVIKSAVIELDGKQAAPVFTRGDFVTMTSTGIFTRPDVIDESREEAIVGLNYIFKFEGMPNKVLFRWNEFTENLTRLPVTSSDPIGGDKVILRYNENSYEWSNRLKGFRVQEIKPIEVTTYPLPLISIVIFILAGIYISFHYINRKSIARVDSQVIYGLLAIAFILYPFLRFGVFLPFIDNWKPNMQEAEMLSGALLTNVYRSLDLRDEEAVYDRLALTVFGDQLSEIYLQSRKSMELENRGGARGKVNDVEILKIKSIKDLDDNRIAIELDWKVSGSVTHFGHTHYRQNKNNAVMTIMPIDQVWKVESIDIIDEKRLL